MRLARDRALGPKGCWGVGKTPQCRPTCTTSIAKFRQDTDQARLATRGRPTRKTTPDRCTRLEHAQNVFRPGPGWGGCLCISGGGARAHARDETGPAFSRRRRIERGPSSLRPHPPRPPTARLLRPCPINPLPRASMGSRRASPCLSTSTSAARPRSIATTSPSFASQSTQPLTHITGHPATGTPARLRCRATHSRVLVTQPRPCRSVTPPSLTLPSRAKTALRLNPDGLVPLCSSGVPPPAAACDPVWVWVWVRVCCGGRGGGNG